MHANNLQSGRKEWWVLARSLQYHRTGNLAWFNSFKANRDSDDQIVNICDAKSGRIVLGTGNIKVFAMSGNKRWKKLELHDVQYIPGSENFVSLNQLEKTGFKKVSKDDEKKIKFENVATKETLAMVAFNETFKTDFLPQKNSLHEITNFLRPSDAIDLWNLRMLHSGQNSVEASWDAFRDVTGIGECRANIVKPYNQSFCQSQTEIVFIITEMNVHSINQHKYIIMFVDRAVFYTWAFPIKQFEDAVDVVNGFVSTLTTKFTRKIAKLSWIPMKQMDAETRLHDMCSKYKIEHGRLDQVVETIQFNRLRNIVDKNFDILKSTGLPMALWSYTLDTVVFLQNSILEYHNTGLASKFYSFWGKKPTSKHLRVIGTPSWAVDGLNRDKTPTHCFALGYDTVKNMHLFYNAIQHKCFASNQYVCYEEVHLFYSNMDSNKKITSDLGDPRNEINVSNFTEIQVFDHVLRSVKSVQKADGTFHLQDLQRVIKVVDESIFDKFLKVCVKSRYVVGYTCGNQSNLKKFTCFHRYKLPASNNLTIYTCDDKLLFNNNEPKQSMFRVISVALFGTSTFANCLRVLLVRHIVHNWNALERGCDELFSVTFSKLVLAAITTKIAGIEPFLLMFSNMLKRPIFLTALGAVFQENVQTFYFAANTNYVKVYKRTPLFLACRSEKLYARLPHSPGPISEIGTKMAINWCRNVVPQDKCGPNTSMYDSRTHFVGMVMPVIHSPKFLKQDLYMKALEIMKENHDHLYGQEPNLADIRRQEDRFISMSEIVSNLLKELKTIFSTCQKHIQNEQIVNKCTGCNVNKNVIPAMMENIHLRYTRRLEQEKKNITSERDAALDKLQKLKVAMETLQLYPCNMVQPPSTTKTCDNYTDCETEMDDDNAPEHVSTGTHHSKCVGPVEGKYLVFPLHPHDGYLVLPNHNSR